MSKQVYISADYDPGNGDRDVVNEICKWCEDPRRNLTFYDTANPSYGSVSANPDCRPCDLKAEFNNQINASSAVIFVVGDKTAHRTAGSSCKRMGRHSICTCTPYKQNVNGTKWCKYSVTYPATESDIGNINDYSYLEHEFRQAVRRNKNIVIVYNSLNYQPSWLPAYMSDYADDAHPFWTKNSLGYRVGDYQYIKKALGYE